MMTPQTDHVAERKRERQRAYNAANKDAIREKKLSWYAANIERIKQSRREYRLANREAINEKARAYGRANNQRRVAAQRKSRIENKTKWTPIIRKSQLKYLYGLSQADRDALFTSQNNCCGICRTTNSGRRDWCIDHCHASGKIRGILCSHCNTLLGMARDKVDVLEKAIAYLKFSEL